MQRESQRLTRMEARLDAQDEKIENVRKSVAAIHAAIADAQTVVANRERETIGDRGRYR